MGSFFPVFCEGKTFFHPKLDRKYPVFCEGSVPYFARGLNIPQKRVPYFARDMQLVFPYFVRDILPIFPYFVREKSKKSPLGQGWFFSMMMIHQYLLFF